MMRSLIGVVWVFYFLGVVGVASKLVSDNLTLDVFLNEQLADGVTVALSWPARLIEAWLP